MLGFWRGDDAMLSSRGRGRLDGMTELVWYMAALGKEEGDAFRMAPFCMANICWGLANWAATAGLKGACEAMKAAGSIMAPASVMWGKALPL